MSVSRGWTRGKQRMVKLTCSAFIPEEDYDRIRLIAKKQGWNQKMIEEYIAEEGWKVFGTSFFSCDEEYDEKGNKIADGYS